MTIERRYRLLQDGNFTAPWKIFVGSKVVASIDGTTGSATFGPPVSGFSMAWPTASGLGWVVYDNALLPATVGVGPALVGGSGSPNRGRIIIGDGSGWQFDLSKRSASVTTDLVRFTDSGAISALGIVSGTLVDLSPDIGQYTGTLTGCTTSPTVTITWARIGSLVILNIPAVTGTSNTTAATITGLMPASIQPTRAQNILYPTIDNGSGGVGGLQVNVASSTIVLLKYGAAGYSATFTNAGLKGTSGGVFCYLLN